MKNHIKFVALISISLLYGCSTIGVSDFSSEYDIKTIPFEYSYTGTIDNIAKQLTSTIENTTQIKHYHELSTSTNLRRVRGQKSEVKCVELDCMVSLIYLNGEFTPQFGTIASSQTIKIPLSFEKNDNSIKGKIIIPNKVDYKIRRNMIGLKKSPYLDDALLKEVISDLSAIKLPDNILDPLKIAEEAKLSARQAKLNTKRLFNKATLQAKNIGEVICTANNKFGYVEKISGKRIQIRLKGAVNKESYYFFANNSDDRFNYKKLNEIVWDESTNWGQCTVNLI